MAFRNISVSISTNVAGFRQQMAAAGQSVQQFGAAAEKQALASKQGAHAVGLALTAMGAAASAAAVVGVKAAADLEVSMKNVATISDDVAAHFGAATSQVLDLSTKLPQSADNLAKGLYDIASSGFQGAAGMQVLTASATAASAGLSDTSTAATAITGVLNAYGMSAGQATDVSDIMFQTVNKGVLTFADLAQNMGDIAPIAAAAGISFDQAGAALAAMTLSGLPAAEASTALSGVIRGLIAPSDAMTAKLEGLGYATGTQALQALGLKGVLDALTASTHGNADAWVALFPDIRAARGAMAATANDGKNYAAVSGAITDANQRQGATAAALAIQQQSLSAQMTLLHNEITKVAIEFGQALLPVLKVVVGGVGDLVSGFDALPGPVRTAVEIVGLLGGGVAALGGAFLLLAPQLTAAKALIADVAAESTLAAGAIDLVKASMGPIGIALLLATPLLAAFGAQQKDTKNYVDALKDSLDAQTGALGKNSAAVVAKRITDKNLDEDAAHLGINIDTLTQAMLGNKDAIAAVERATNASTRSIVDLSTEAVNGATAHYDYGSAQDRVAKAVSSGTKALKDAKDEHDRNAKATDAATRALDGNTTSTAINADAHAGAVPPVDLHAQAMQKLAESIAGVADPLSAYKAAQQAASDTTQKAATTAKTAISARFQAEKDGNAAAEKDEKASLDRQVQTRKDALDAEHKTLVDALDLRHRAEQEAFDAESRTQKEALDDQQRTQKEALDRRLRDQQEALDKELAAIDKQTAQRKRDEDRAYDAEKDRLQLLVDSTFGTEREGYKAQLNTLEDSHQNKLADIGQAGDDQKQTLKDGLDDQQQVLKDGLADQQRAEKDSLDGRLQVLKDGLTDRENAEKTAEDTRYNTAKTALDNDTAQLQGQLDDKYVRLNKHLEDRQKAEETAADARYTSTGAKNAVSLAQYQTFLDDSLKKADKFNNDLAIIASRGGTDVMDTLRQMDPAIVAQAAAAGPAALTAFLESIRANLAAGTRAPGLPAGVGGGVSHKGGQQAADGLFASAAYGVLWNEPEAAGESYIPHAMSKRPRATTILARTADVFGYDLIRMANGGIISGSAGGGGTVVNYIANVDVQARVDAGIDLGVAGRVIADQVNRGINAGFDDLRRRIVVTSGRS